MNQYIANLHVGASGVGKTHLAVTFPKCFIISTEPNHHWVWQMNPELAKNVIWQKYFIPDPNTFKNMFMDMQKDINTAKQMFADGKIDTLVLDNLTYLIHNRWLWMNQYQKILTRQGELDTRSMYGQLRTWCYEFMLMNIMSFKGHIVVNVHEMQESDEALEKKVDKSLSVVPNLLGGFRNDIDGMFSNIFYLTKLNDGKGGYKYVARCNKGNNRNAKNRFGLPEIIENVSYQTIVSAIDKAINKEGK